MAKQLTGRTHMWEFWISNPGPNRSYATLQTVRRRFNVYATSCAALALCSGDGHHKLVTRFGVKQRVE